MTASKKQEPRGIGSHTTLGADAIGPTGLRPEELYDGTGLGDTPGTLGLNDGAGTIALVNAGGAAGKRAARGSGKLKMKVQIFEHPKRSVFTDKMRKSIQSAVSSEFRRIRSQLNKSKAEFSVSWTQPKKLSPTAAVPKVLQVYVIETSADAIQQAAKILKAAIPSVRIKAQEIADHVSNEGGFNYKKVGGQVSVSFASVSRIEQYKKAGVAGIDKMFANLISHELGHGMDAGHSDRGLMDAHQVYDSRGGVPFKYSKASIKKIDKFLSGI